MTFNNQTQKSKYIAGIKELLQLFYGTKDLNSAYRKKLESKIDGFIAAGILIGLISKPELQTIIATSISALVTSSYFLNSKSRFLVTKLESILVLCN